MKIIRDVLIKKQAAQMKNKMGKSTSKVTSRRLAKGQRTHIRWLKQQARKEGVVYKPGYQPSYEVSSN
jgi:hypothetical protein